MIVLPGSLQLPNGATATGKIHVETLLIKQRGDMVGLDKPTTSFGRLLVTGGEIFVGIRKGNEELHLAPGKTIAIIVFNSNLFFPALNAVLHFLFLFLTNISPPVTKKPSK